VAAVVQAEKDVLFVWFESSVWNERIQTKLLPKLGRRAVVLNWSQRAQWTGRLSLARMAFRHFGGRRERLYNYPAGRST